MLASGIPARSPPPFAPLLIAFIAVLISAARPLVPIGARIGPGWGDFLNGALALLLLVVAGVWALASVMRRRRR